MKTLNSHIALITLVAIIAGCDSSTGPEADSFDLIDEAVLGGKPVKAAITAVNSSGWSGELTTSRSKDGSLRWKITASGTPNVLVSFCIFNASDVGPCFAGPITNDRGGLRTGWRGDPSNSAPGDTRKWNIRVAGVIVATSGQIVVP